MRALALLLAVATPACITLGPGEPDELREWDLLPAPVAAVEPAPGAPSLQVLAFGVSEVLDRDVLVWRRGEVEVGAYARQRWARPPQEAARAVLVAALRDALGPAAVIVADPPLPAPDYVLRGHLARFEEVDRGEVWCGVVEVHAALARRDGVELLRRVYRVERTAPERNPRGVVTALRAAALEVGAALAEDVTAALGLEAGAK